MKRIERHRPSIWTLLPVLTLATLLSSGCRETAERLPGGAARTTAKGDGHAATAPPPAAPDHSHAAGTAEPQGIRLSAAARANLNLHIAEATPRPIEHTLKAPGVVKAQPDRVAHVTPRLEARIEKVYVNVGDAVQPGTPLLELRSVEGEKLQVELLRAAKSLSILEQSYARSRELTEKTVLIELEKLQQELIQAHSASQVAAAEVERHQQLSDKAVARKELLTAQKEYQHARSTYDTVQRQMLTHGITEAQIRTILTGGTEKPVLVNLGLNPQAAVQKYLVLGNPGELFKLETEYREKQVEVESLKRQLQILGVSAADVAALLQRGTPSATFTLTAPIAGVVSAREATRGAVVGSSEKLVEIIDASVVWVEGSVAENLLAAVQAGQTARVRVASYPEAVFTGTVRAVGRTVNPEKRTIHLWVEVANPEGKLLPEMFADVTLVTQTATEALAVPLQAILTEGAERFVFVENGDTYVKHNVVLGLKDDRYIEIRDGLFPGDRVVVRGGFELNAAQALATQQARGGDVHGGHAH